MTIWQCWYHPWIGASHDKFIQLTSPPSSALYNDDSTVLTHDVEDITMMENYIYSNMYELVNDKSHLRGPSCSFSQNEQTIVWVSIQYFTSKILSRCPTMLIFNIRCGVEYNYLLSSHRPYPENWMLFLLMPNYARYIRSTDKIYEDWWNLLYCLNNVPPQLPHRWSFM